MIKFLLTLLISTIFHQGETIRWNTYQVGTIEYCQPDADTIPKKKTPLVKETPSFHDAIDQDNLLKAEVNRSDSSMWIRGDIKKDYRIFGYERASTKSKPLILFSVFTRDVESNPYKCRYGAFYSTSDLAFEQPRIKFKGFSGKFVRTDFVIEGKVVDTFYFERKWVTFTKW
jgi:hypothetical protein